MVIERCKLLTVRHSDRRDFVLSDLVYKDGVLRIFLVSLRYGEPLSVYVLP